MLVCVCKGVNDKKIEELLQQGIVKLEDLQKHSEIGTKCGSCLNFLLESRPYSHKIKS
jgi:bacterioferritin-associated ferredoxin